MVNFTCAQCGRKYIYRGNFGRHVKSNHTAHPVFGCDQCARSFTRSSNLEKHKRPCTGGQLAGPATKKTLYWCCSRV